jgi:hypothetical protein
MFVELRRSDIKRKGKSVPGQREEKVVINDEITYDKVRLIDEDGGQLGVVSANEARERAYELALIWSKYHPMPIRPSVGS